MTAAGPTPRRALLVDYGGVLTRGLGSVFREAEQAAGVPDGALVGVLLAAYEDPDGDGFVHRFERGEISTTDFEARLRWALAEQGHEISDEPLLAKVFAGLGPDPDGAMWDVVRRAREAGVATALLSNSWGVDGYPKDRLAACFDDLVISGEVGLRKPDPAIYRLAAARVDAAPEDCAFVDDFVGNVEAARGLGMFGVVHRGDAEETARELEGFLDVALA